MSVELPAEWSRVDHAQVRDRLTESAGVDPNVVIALWSEAATSAKIVLAKTDLPVVVDEDRLGDVRRSIGEIVRNGGEKSRVVEVSPSRIGEAPAYRVEIVVIDEAQAFVQVHYVFSTPQATYAVTFCDLLVRRERLLRTADRVTASMTAEAPAPTPVRSSLVLWAALLGLAWSGWRGVAQGGVRRAQRPPGK